MPNILEPALFLDHCDLHVLHVAHPPEPPLSPAVCLTAGLPMPRGAKS